MKALMYPMKIEYQRETYREIISEEFVSKKFDAYNFQEQLRNSVKESQGLSENFREFLVSSLKYVGKIADNVLKKSPFQPGVLEYKRLKISLLLNAVHSLKTKKKLDSELPTIILWKLPKSISNYVRILIKEFYTEIKLEILECYKQADIDDDVVDRLLQNSSEEVLQYENWD